MTRISAYLAREFLPVFLLVLAFALFLLSLVNMFQAVDLLVSHAISPGQVFYYWLLLNGYLLSHAISLAAMVATIIVFCRFTQDQELIAVKSLGIHLGRVVAPLLVIGLLASLLKFGVTGFLQPSARYQARTFRVQARTGPEIRRLRPGSIITEFPGLVIFVPTAGTGRETVIYQRDEATVRMAFARRATLRRAERGLFLKLENGAIQVYDPEQPERQEKLAFQTYNFPLPGLEKPFEKPPRRTREKTFFRLLEENTRQSRVEAASRFSYALAPLFLMIVAAPLGIFLHRNGLGVLVACAVVLGYVMALGLLEEWLPARENRLPDLLLMAPNLCLLAAGGFLLRKVR